LRSSLRHVQARLEEASASSSYLLSANTNA
jgi:hypothetical protein